MTSTQIAHTNIWNPCQFQGLDMGGWMWWAWRLWWSWVGKVRKGGIWCWALGFGDGHDGHSGGFYKSGPIFILHKYTRMIKFYIESAVLPRFSSPSYNSTATPSWSWSAQLTTALFPYSLIPSPLTHHCARFRLRIRFQRHKTPSPAAGPSPSITFQPCQLQLSVAIKL